MNVTHIQVLYYNQSDHYDNRLLATCCTGRTGRVGNLGKATSFVDIEGDGDVMPKLVDMLTKVPF